MFARTESLKQYIRLYPVTTALIVINLIVLGLMEWYGSSQDNETLYRFGALFDLPGETAEPWRYVTAIFLHIGFSHLLFNCFTLYVFAPPLEIMLGKWRYILLYLVSGIVGNIASMLLHQDYFISAGASGALYGIYAAYLYLAIFRKDIIDKQTKQTIVTIIVIGFLYSVIVPRVDLYAHFGGFVGGFATIALIALSIKRRYRKMMEEYEEQGHE
ncbi:rhomboid family intramembrane serine protease [Paenibacillus contaminans]|uniref:Rhomboid family intramembrane serine protease n=1 Tax=Paenibacillus contaminans TaxID=450362 RepID=A0A329MPW4_9BACL|nr:rhomboid family intramembrane serine protease [Paenibacillus contaminans]RAV21326.1 rhomboid family intramembrane serine protease [Paenibacillus contaminans]